VAVVSNVVADKYGLQVGTPALSSAGAITFGPEGILFVADSAAATIFAIQVGDDATSAEPVEVVALDTRVGSLLGVAREDVRIAGMAVHPGSQAVYLSVARGRGASQVPVLIRVTNGELAVAELVDVPFARSGWMTRPAWTTTVRILCSTALTRTVRPSRSGVSP
jgi:hypothetical protein